MSSPLVSAILVSFDRSEDLRLSLQALTGSSHSKLEIIVVEDASRADAAAVASSFPGVKVIRNAESRGFADATNIGLSEASGDYLVLVDGAAVVAEDWIEKAVEFLESNPQSAAVGGKVYDWNETSPVGCRDNEYRSYTLVDPESGSATVMRNTPDEVREVASLSRAVVMIRREAIEDVGAPFFEPSFRGHYEELDFFARALRKGWKLHYIGEPAAWHRSSAKADAEPYRHSYSMARERVVFAYRNFDDASLARLVKATARQAVSDLAKWPTQALGEVDEAARGRRDAHLWLLENRSLLREQRARSRASDGISYNEAVRDIRARAEYYGHERLEVVALVPKDAKYVVDVGCGAGGLGRALKRERPGVEVRGIEIVPEQAERAKKVLDDVRVGGAEEGMPSHWPRPDCVIFADVLEHLVDPWTALRQWRDILGEGGTIVVSLPNVGHREVLGGVLRGRWDYQEAGILDRTHLRFFTRATALELIESAGFRVVRFERALDGRGHSLRKLARKLGNGSSRKLPRSTKALPTPADFVADLHTVQFLLVAV